MDNRMTVHAINLLQNKIASFGIAAAPEYEYYPADLDTVDLPLILSYPGRGLRKSKTGHTSLRRSFYVEGFTGPMGLVSARLQRVKTASLIDELSIRIDDLNDGDANILDYGDQSGIYVAIDYTRDIEDSGPVADINFTGAPSPAQKYFGFQMIVPLHIRWGDRV